MSIQSFTWKDQLEKVMKIEEYIMVKCNNNLCVSDNRSYDINLPYYGVGTPVELLVWKEELLKVLEGQGISMQFQRYTFTECQLTDDTKATFILITLDIGISIVENFNKVLAKMT